MLEYVIGIVVLTVVAVLNSNQAARAKKNNEKCTGETIPKQINVIFIWKPVNFFNQRINLNCCSNGNKKHKKKKEERVEKGCIYYINNYWN